MKQENRPKPLPLHVNTLWNTVGCMVYQGCLWLTTILVVTLSFNFENSGILAFAMTIGNIFYPIATYNIRTFQATDIKNEYSNSNYIAFRLLTSIGAFIICVVYCLIISPSCITMTASILFLFFKFDEAFANVLYGIEQKNSRMDYIGISQLSRGILLFAAFTLSLYFSNSLAFAIVAMTIACFSVTLIYDIPHSLRFGKVRPSINFLKVKKMLIQCAPLVISSTLCGAIVSVAREYFGIVQGEELLGIYAAIATPTVIIQAAAVYLYSPFITPMAQAWENIDIKSFIKLLGTIVGILISLSIVLIVAFSIFGQDVLTLIFGQTISPYTYLLIPALIGTSLISLMYLSIDLLVLMRKFIPLSLATGASFLFCIFSMKFFIDTFGMNGINLVIIFSNAFGCIFMMVCIVSYIKTRNSNS